MDPAEFPAFTARATPRSSTRACWARERALVARAGSVLSAPSKDETVRRDGRSRARTTCARPSRRRPALASGGTSERRYERAAVRASGGTSERRYEYSPDQAPAGDVEATRRGARSFSSRGALRAVRHGLPAPRPPAVNRAHLLPSFGRCRSFHVTPSHILRLRDRAIRKSAGTTGLHVGNRFQDNFPIRWKAPCRASRGMGQQSDHTTRQSGCLSARAEQVYAHAQRRCAPLLRDSPWSCCELFLG
jgi:hypothetical protein